MIKEEDLIEGTKITLVDNKKYIILENIIKNGKKYIVCASESKPITPIIFEYRVIDGDICVEYETDSKIAKEIFEKMKKENLE